MAATGLTQVQTVQGQLLQHQSGTYLIQGGTMDGEGTPLTHTTRASPVTVSLVGTLLHADFSMRRFSTLW